MKGFREGVSNPLKARIEPAAHQMQHHTRNNSTQDKNSTPEITAPDTTAHKIQWHSRDNATPLQIQQHTRYHSTPDTTAFWITTATPTQQHPATTTHQL
jgi:hypothetical protein